MHDNARVNSNNGRENRSYCLGVGDIWIRSMKWKIGLTMNWALGFIRMFGFRVNLQVIRGERKNGFS